MSTNGRIKFVGYLMAEVNQCPAVLANDSHLACCTFVESHQGKHLTADDTDIEWEDNAENDALCAKLRKEWEGLPELSEEEREP